MAKRRPTRPTGRPRVPQREHRINDEIRVPEVRIVGMEDESQNGIFPTRVALKMADELELDLVEVAASANPPVCRIIEYSKFAYEQKKRMKANKAKQQVTVMKEIRFGPNTDEHDFQFKVRHAQKFLQEGNKLKAWVQFRGRNILYKDRGQDILDRFAEALADDGKIEMAPRMEGRKMIMIMAPLKQASPTK